MMLKDLLDWDKILEAPRGAGGHEDIMTVLFKDAVVIASYIEDGWQGTEAFAYHLADDRYVLVTDYFGSCGGCDNYESASNEEIHELCVALANNARIFDSLDEMINYIEGVEEEAGSYPMWASTSLLPYLMKL